MNQFTTVNNVNLSLDEFMDGLHHAQSRWKHRKIELDNMISRLPLLLFGYGGKGQALAQHIKNNTEIELVIFDASIEKRALAKSQGFKIIDELTNDVLSKMAVILGACQAQLEQKETVGHNYIYYQEAACLLGAAHLENLASDFQDYVLKHARELFQVVKWLSTESQENILAVLKFRLSLDPSDLHITRKPNRDMWLDVLTKSRKRPYDTFLDVGAFDGDTLRMFQDSFSCLRGIAVEANAELFEDIRLVEKKYALGVNILPMAAWSKRTRLNFEEVRFGMIKVIEDENGGLQASAIDDFVSERIDVLKMDIEGAECKALEGCIELLNRWKPDLAIAAYHRPEDFVALFAQLGRYGYQKEDFKWNFAHYSDCIDDSIFYVTRIASTGI